MNKSEFLQRLESKLLILNDNEKNDILTEYSDVIDQKVIEGKTEEEAVQDFGDFNRLISEIYEAYHINTNLDYESEKSEQIEENTPFYKLMTKNIKSISKTTWEGISKGFFYLSRKTKGLYRVMSNRIIQSIERKKQRKELELATIKDKIENNHQINAEQQNKEDTLAMKWNQLNQVNHQLKVEKSKLKEIQLEQGYIEHKKKKPLELIGVILYNILLLIFRLIIIILTLWKSFCVFCFNCCVFVLYLCTQALLYLVIIMIALISIIINLTFIVLAGLFGYFSYHYDFDYIFISLVFAGLFFISLGTMSSLNKLIKQVIKFLSFIIKKLVVKKSSKEVKEHEMAD